VGNPFSWSLSRHSTFTSCRRRYYYSYYGAAEDPEIRRLKGLSALPLWAGTVVHDAIERFLRENDQLPSPEEREAFVHEVVHSGMVADWRESESGSHRFRLFEHEYRVPVEAEDKKIAVGTVTRSLKNFFASATLGEALEAGRGRWLSLEELVSFEVDDVTVLLRMDLAYRTREDGAVIVDWKTGRSEGRFNDVQLAGYALYASTRGWVGSPEELQTELAYLALPRYTRRPVDAPRLEQAKGFVVNSAAAMRVLLADEKTNRAEIEAFPMIDDPRTCRRCNFRRLCFPRADEATTVGLGPSAPDGVVSG
jgi:hypothetical protein